MSLPPVKKGGYRLSKLATSGSPSSAAAQQGAEASNTAKKVSGMGRDQTTTPSTVASTPDIQNRQNMSLVPPQSANRGVSIATAPTSPPNARPVSPHPSAKPPGSPRGTTGRTVAIAHDANGTDHPGRDANGERRSLDFRKSLTANLITGDQKNIMYGYRAKLFKIGDRARARNDEREDWVVGTVVDLSPVVIKPDGQQESVGPSSLIGYWKFIQKLQSSGVPVKMHNFKDSCRRCHIESVWAACDTFWSFDVRHTGVITRKEYMARLGDPPTAIRLRLLRRSKLENRFRQSAKPVTMDEFLKLCWPTADENDMVLMRRWCQLREAKNVLSADSFKGVENEMRRVFELLDGLGQGTVCAIALVRSQILTAQELEHLIQKKDFKSTHLDLEAFRGQLWQHLKNEYCTKEAMLQARKDEEASMAVKFSPPY